VYRPTDATVDRWSANFLSDRIGPWLGVSTSGRPLRPSTASAKPRVRYVVEHCGLPFVIPPEPPDRQHERLLFLGDDQDGIPLEVMAVELLDDSLYVIHAMELRP
jgi:hypothetical protein